jgi:hypothetical protein
MRRVATRMNPTTNQYTYTPESQFNVYLHYDINYYFKFVILDLVNCYVAGDLTLGPFVLMDPFKCGCSFQLHTWLGHNN